MPSTRAKAQTLLRRLRRRPALTLVSVDEQRPVSPAFLLARRALKAQRFYDRKTAWARIRAINRAICFIDAAKPERRGTP